MNYSALKKFDIANGPGVRVSLFVSGCTNRCKGCFNKETWDFSYGKKFSSDTMNEILKAISSEYISGFSILGGDPLAEDNIKEVSRIIKNIKEVFGDMKDIWLWTGYTYDDILNKSKTNEYLKYIVENINVMVDGLFIEEEKDLSLQYAGSRNQKIIYLK